jgi:hypothetical protein
LQTSPREQSAAISHCRSQLPEAEQKRPAGQSAFVAQGPSHAASSTSDDARMTVRMRAPIVTQRETRCSLARLGEAGDRPALGVEQIGEHDGVGGERQARERAVAVDVA